MVISGMACFESPSSSVRGSFSSSKEQFVVPDPSSLGTRAGINLRISQSGSRRANKHAESSSGSPKKSTQFNISASISNLALSSESRSQTSTSSFHFKHRQYHHLPETRLINRPAISSRTYPNKLQACHCQSLRNASPEPSTFHKSPSGRTFLNPCFRTRSHSRQLQTASTSGVESTEFSADSDIEHTVPSHLIITPARCTHLSNDVAARPKAKSPRRSKSLLVVRAPFCSSCKFSYSGDLNLKIDGNANDASESWCSCFRSTFSHSADNATS
ncbi:unnamed protein product, partial [Protopolystoma xenopodis]